VRKEFTFHFGAYTSKARIRGELPGLDEIRGGRGALLIGDSNTAALARKISGGAAPVCAIKAGEEHKSWENAAGIISAAREAGLGRDGVFIAVGGGVVSDLAGFAASVYMRGAGFQVVSTTLLGMVDAALGGKTGFDYLGIKNLVGSFYPAEGVIMPLDALESLPPAEWKSGMAELIKTAVISGSAEFFSLVKKLKPPGDGRKENLAEAIALAVETKGRIVEEDPRETGTRRALLNLGHTFGHALESAAGLGAVTHGEAVAWGMARSCELGLRLGITPPEKAREITALLNGLGYETAAPHPLGLPAETLLGAMKSDKKRKQGKLAFIVPAGTGAVIVSEDDTGGLKAGSLTTGLVEKIVNGEYIL
jgi:3-dehydroquinate synthase